MSRSSRKCSWIIQNLAKPPLMRICRGFENWRDLRALSGKFLRQKSCYPESFRFLWLCTCGTRGRDKIVTRAHFVEHLSCFGSSWQGLAGSRWQGQHFAWAWSRSKPLVITMLNKHPLSLYTMSSFTLFGRPRERRFVFVTHAYKGCRQSHSTRTNWSRKVRELILDSDSQFQGVKG